VTDTDWTTLRVRRFSESAPVVRALFALGAEGVQELDGEVVTHLRDIDEAAARAAIGGADRGADIEFSRLDKQDWTTEWRARVGAHRLGRLVVTPPWLAAAHQEHERVVIDPAMAFGTGEHETTRGVLRLMQRVVKSDDVVADLGAGSAVLSIAAARLGARRAIAIELDHDAIGNAEQNVAANGVSDRVSVIEGDAAVLLPLVAPVRVILANIISSVLLELLPAIELALTEDGVAILSGILVDERADMEATLARRKWRVVDVDQEGLWWSATVVPG
jgi:ribosomal protein L11 methyltransferase